MMAICMVEMREKPVAAQSMKLKASAVPVWCGRTRRILESCWCRVHMGGMKKLEADVRRMEVELRGMLSAVFTAQSSGGREHS